MATYTALVLFVSLLVHNASTITPPVVPPAVTAPAPAGPAQLDYTEFFKSIEAHCEVVSADDPIVIMFLADDGTFQIGNDCFSAFKAWRQLRPQRPLPLA